MGLKYGIACSEDYVRTPCDCRRDCDRTHFATNQGYIDCSYACYEEEEACENECEEDRTDIQDARATCRSDCAETAAGCRQGCVDACDGVCGNAQDACNAQCLANFPPPNNSTRQDCYLDCAEEAQDCMVACQPAKDACDLDCSRGHNLCAFDCDSDYYPADFDLTKQEQTCRKNCCAEAQDHPTTCQNGCEIDYTDCEKVVSENSRPCARECVAIQMSDPEAAGECFDACEEIRLAAHNECTYARYFCDNECLVDDKRRTKQCDWFFSHCELKCLKAHQVADAACETDACHNTANSTLYDCRLRCCTDRYGKDPYTTCYAACWHSSHCEQSTSVCQEALTACIAGCDGDPSCYYCGVRAAAFFSV